MEINAVLGAILGAIVGAIVWAGLTVATGYEIGWVAWGVGGVVGLGAHVLGGRGTTSGMVCALLAAVAILGGKVMVVHHFVSNEFGNLAEQAVSEDLYTQILEESRTFSTLSSEADYPGFMVAWGYTDAQTPADVQPGEVAFFKSEDVPTLQMWATNPPAFEQWKSEATANAKSFGIGQVSMLEILVGSLGVMDALFFFLGVGTAFRVGSGGESD